MEQEQKKSTAMATTETGSFALQSLADQMRFAERLIADKMISETFQTAQQVIIGLQYAKALKLNEIVALRMMYVLKGKPCLYGEGPLSLCQRTGLVSLFDEFFVDKESNRICVANKNIHAPVFASVTRIGRKGDSEIQEDFFTIEDMDRAGLTVSKFGKKDVWVKFERIMLRYKARSLAIKSKFADTTAGIPIAEYDEHFAPDYPEMKEVKSTVADDLNKLYSPGDEAIENNKPGTIELIQK